MWNFLFFVVVAAHANPTEPLKVVKSYKELLECPKESKLVEEKMCCKIQAESSDSLDPLKKCTKHGPVLDGGPSNLYFHVMFYSSGKFSAPIYRFAEGNRFVGAWDSLPSNPTHPEGRVLLVYESGEMFSRGIAKQTGSGYFSGTWEIFSPQEKALYKIDFTDKENSFSKCTMKGDQCQSLNGRMVAKEQIAQMQVKPVEKSYGLYLGFDKTSPQQPKEVLPQPPGLVKMSLDGEILGFFLLRKLVTRWTHFYSVDYGYKNFSLVSEYQNGWCRVNLLDEKPIWAWVSCHQNEILPFSEDGENKRIFPWYVQPVSSESVREQPGSKQATPWTPALSKLAFDDLQMGIREIRVVRKDGQWWITGEIDSPYLGELESRFQYDPERLALYKKTDITKIRRREVTFPVLYKGSVNVKQLSSDEFDGGF